MATNDEPLDVFELDENLSDVEKPPELPNGTYSAEVQEVQNAVSQAGNAYWMVRFRVPPTEIPPDLAEDFEEGAVFSYHRLMKPAGANARRAKYDLRMFLQALGLDSNTSTIDPTQWIGRECRIIVKNEQYQGEMRAGMKGFEAGEGSPAQRQTAKPTGAKGRARR